MQIYVKTAWRGGGGGEWKMRRKKTEYGSMP